MDRWPGSLMSRHLSSSCSYRTAKCGSFKDNVCHLRGCLQHTGVPADETRRLASHLARACAALTTAREGIPPHEICHIARVSPISWTLGYNCPDTSDRKRVSQDLGRNDAPDPTTSFYLCIGGGRGIRSRRPSHSAACSIPQAPRQRALWWARRRARSPPAAAGTREAPGSGQGGRASTGGSAEGKLKGS